MLYIVATPIGNLEDITLRALRVLGEVDFIAAEDTRRTVKLLNHYHIKTRLVSFHEHSAPDKRAWILDELAQGKNVALVSDAGTPLISDPGAVLVAEAVQRGIPVTSLPGACAAVTALTLSGYGGSFVFIGFLSKKAGEKKRQIQSIAQSALPCVVYESPHALGATLKALALACGAERHVVIAKELTKIHEHVLRGTLGEAAEALDGEIKGEYVLIVGANEEAPAEVDDREIEALIKAYTDGGMTKKDAALAASKQLGIGKNRAYKFTT